MMQSDRSLLCALYTYTYSMLEPVRIFALRFYCNMKSWRTKSDLSMNKLGVSINIKGEVKIPNKHLRILLKKYSLTNILWDLKALLIENILGANKGEFERLKNNVCSLDKSVNCVDNSK